MRGTSGAGDILPLKVCIRIPGPPKSFGTMNTRFTRGGREIHGTRKTKQAAAWEAKVRAEALRAWGVRPISRGPVAVVVTAISALPKGRWRMRHPPDAALRDQRPDIDKILRLVLDALQGVVYEDDAQVAMALAITATGAQGEHPRTIVTVGQAPDVHEIPGMSTEALHDSAERAVFLRPW